MSTAGAAGAANDASVQSGPPEHGDSRLADALAELAAAERRVGKVEASLAGVRASYEEARAEVAALQGGE